MAFTADSQHARQTHRVHEPINITAALEMNLTATYCSEWTGGDMAFVGR